MCIVVTQRKLIRRQNNVWCANLVFNEAGKLIGPNVMFQLRNTYQCTQKHSSVFI